MAQQLQGYDVVDAQGNSLGPVRGLWVDGATREPEFLGVTTDSGMGDTRIVPFAGAEPDQSNRRIRVPYTAEQVASAPHFDATASLSEQDEQRVYQHYGVRRSERSSPTGLAGGGEMRGQMHHGEHTGDAEMTHQHGETDPRPTRGQVEHGGDHHTLELEEERLRVNKQREQAGEIRLGTRVEEHTERVEVPVREERVVIERRPGDGEVRAGEIHDTGDEIEVPVMKERVNVEKETVVAEEVGVRKQVSQHTERIEETVRREEPVIEGDGDVVSDGENLNAPRMRDYEQEHVERR
jgi:uncharacterized protein (TIGR02271 family)